jgi:hypothetical protein
MAALAHERLTPQAGTPLSDQDLSEVVQGTRIDLNIWLRLVSNEDQELYC